MTVILTFGQPPFRERSLTLTLAERVVGAVTAHAAHEGKDVLADDGENFALPDATAVDLDQPVMHAMS